MANYHDIRYDMTLSSSTTGGGSMVLLETQTASSSATISFTSNIDSTYKEYVFKFYDIHPSGDRTYLQFQVDTGTNTSYNQTMTTTFFHAWNDEADTSTGLNHTTGKDLAQGTGFQTISYNAGNANDECNVGKLHLFAPSSSTFVKHFYSTFQTQDNDFSDNSRAAGYVNTTTALTRVQFKMNSGTIDAGTIKLYGVL